MSKNNINNTKIEINNNNLNSSRGYISIEKKETLKIILLL